MLRAKAEVEEGGGEEVRRAGVINNKAHRGKVKKYSQTNQSRKKLNIHSGEKLYKGHQDKVNQPVFAVFVSLVVFPNQDSILCHSLANVFLFVFSSVFVGLGWGSLFLSLVQDNWGALKGKMFGRSLSVEPGRGKEVLSEFKESKGGIKGLKRGEVKGSQKVQQASCSQQSPPERDATSPRKTRRSQRGQTGKGKGEKQGVISTPRNMTVTRFPCCSSFNLQWRGIVSACSSRQL